MCRRRGRETLASYVRNGGGLLIAVGPDIDIMIDVNMGWDADTAIQAGHRIDEFDPYWLEEPVIPDDVAGQARVVREGGIPTGTIVAGGDQACDPHERGSGPLRANSLIIIDIFPRDAQFAEKAGRVLDLYARTWDGTALGSNEFVISADEKPSLQARRRKHPTLAPGPARPMRVEHEYFRTGALTYLAAWDVHHAKLFGRCEPKTTIGAVDRLVEQVMTTEPYATWAIVGWSTSSSRPSASCATRSGRFSSPAP